MAVDSDSKEIKKKNNSNKKKNSNSSSKKKSSSNKKKEDNKTIDIKEENKDDSLEKTVLVDLEDVVKEDLDNTIIVSDDILDDNSIIDKEKHQYGDEEETTKQQIDSSYNTANQNSKKNNKIIILVILISLLLLTTYLLLPNIKLKGDNQVTITYNQEYIENGYNAKFLFKDITKNIKIDSNLDNKKIGKYKINYYLKYGIFKINKTRIINVIDNIKPEIITDGDTVNICPNDEIKDYKYQAIDEYDGDITDKVIQNRLDDKIILSVRDKSNNKIIKEIIIDRVDKTVPEIKLNGNSTIYLGVGANYVEPGYTANDNCDGDITDKVSVSGYVGTTAGTYKLTYSVSDNNDNKTEVIRTIIVRNYNLYNSGSINNGTIYLTFDDGPNEGTTNVILDILKEQGIKATFFVTCNGPDYLIKRIYDEGHTVALHTATHDYSYVYSSVDNYFNDLNRVGDRVKNITGIESKIIRFPGGSSNTVSRRYQNGIMTTLTGMVIDKGYRYFDWNVDAMDASSARSSSDVYYNVINHLSMSRANVVLMHDTKGITRDALRNIIKTASSQGYTFSRIEMDTYMVRHGVNN